jgi:alginate O-acetyltransferase complex protein AlgI
VLFNSREFIFGFLPVVFTLFFLIARRSHFHAAAWLGLASLFFYGYWSIRALPILVISICVNYLFGKRIVLARSQRASRAILFAGVALDLVVLGFFKYADFFIGTANVALEEISLDPVGMLGIVLPIGISFFTFTQIAYLVDCWEGKVAERNFVHYVLFVSYFPHLVAGPVLHHAQIMPQFARPETYTIDSDKIAVGLALFAIGLSKKLLLADPLGEYANILFDGTKDGLKPMFLMSWLGVLSYTFQIYFDFSGYSDMAIGLSLLFGISLPLNFYSPYKATSITDFWRRWHISLSTFLRNYLYVPLGGNRRGKARRYFNLMVTMLLGGLWHGANWTFVLWGGAHGLFLCVNHAWRRTGIRLPVVVSWAITFLAVVMAWVLFRSESAGTSTKIYKGLFGLNGISLPTALEGKVSLPGVSFAGVWQGVAASAVDLAVLLAVAFAICLLLPSSSQLAVRYVDCPEDARPIQLRRWMAVGLGTAFAVCLFSLGKVSPFLYFRF